MPREQVIGKLFGLFGANEVEVRWTAAGVVLHMSTTTQLASS